MMRTKFGTIRPTKPIGPQKAVTKPASKATSNKMNHCVRLRFIPKAFACVSPSCKAFKGFTKRKVQKIRIEKSKLKKGSCSKATFCSEPMLHNENDFSAFPFAC